MIEQTSVIGINYLNKLCDPLFRKWFPPKNPKIKYDINNHYKIKQYLPKDHPALEPTLKDITQEFHCKLLDIKNNFEKSLKEEDEINVPSSQILNNYYLFKITQRSKLLPP